LTQFVRWNLLTNGDISVCVPAFIDPSLTGYNIQAGDLYHIVRDPEAYPVIYTTGSDSVAFSNVHIRTAPAFGFSADHSSNVAYVNCSVKQPLGSTRLLASVRDGMFLRNMVETHVIESTIQNTGDDGIGLHTDNQLVAQASTNGNTVLVGPDWDFLWSIMQVVGQQIEIFDRTTLASRGIFSVLGITTVAGGSPCANAPAPVRQLTLSGNVTTNCGDAILLYNLLHNGFSVYGNTCRNIRGRAIFCAGSDGAISWNTIDESTFVGIQLGGEAEGPLSPTPRLQFCRGVSIDHNSIRNVGWSLVSRGPIGPRPGAISISAGHNQSTWPTAMEHANIVINNNVINEVGLAAIFMASTNGAAIYENICINPQRLPDTALGSLSGVTQPFAGTLVTQQVQGVSLFNNLLEVSPTDPATSFGAASSVSVGTNFTCHATGFEDYEFPLPVPPTSPSYPSLLRLPPSIFLHPPGGGTWNATIDGFVYTFQNWQLGGNYTLYSHERGAQSAVSNVPQGTVTIQNLASPKVLFFQLAATNTATSSTQACVVEYRQTGTTGTWTQAATIPVSSLPAPLVFVVQGVQLNLVGSYDLRFRNNASSGTTDFVLVDEMQVVY
jgi:hypothetical protein